MFGGLFEMQCVLLPYCAGTFIQVQYVQLDGWSGSPVQLVDIVGPVPFAPPFALRSPPLPHPVRSASQVEHPNAIDHRFIETPPSFRSSRPERGSNIRKIDEPCRRARARATTVSRCCAV
jgi:hypothetical protein